MKTESQVGGRRPETGFRPFLAGQTPLSWSVGGAGAISLFLLVLGTLGLVTAGGWTPSAKIAQTLTGRAQTAVLLASLAFGIPATGAGWLLYKRMPTKASREASVSGAALGTQSVVLAALVLWFRAGRLDIFARNFFEFEILSDFWPRFIRGAANTVVLALSGEALGILLGLVLSVLTLSTRPTVRAPARAYINFFRGTPLLWQLNIGFFGLVLGLRLNLTAYQAAILILGLNAGAYSAEIFRAGIQSIERGQFEAARSLGMSYFGALWYVILPQAFRRVIPPLTNEFVILIKDTSLVSVLGLTFNERELMAVGRNLYATFFNATPFLASAAGYLVVTLPMIRAVTWLERRMRSGIRLIGA